MLLNNKINFSQHLVKVLHFIHKPLSRGKLDSKTVIAEWLVIRYEVICQTRKYLLVLYVFIPAQTYIHYLLPSGSWHP